MGLYWRGLVHDMSKLSPKEFGPYARYFYGKYPDQPEYYGDQRNANFNARWKGSVQDDFNDAWLNHQHHNPHHWQYWVLKEDDGPQIAIDMPYEYLLEMVCDWRGASKAITGTDNTKNWYIANKDKMILHDITRYVVELLIYGKDGLPKSE